MTKFVAFDDQAIWGIGDTAEAALEDVRTTVGGEEIERILANMKTAAATAALAACVESEGGDCAFDWMPPGRHAGVLGLCDRYASDPR